MQVALYPLAHVGASSTVDACRTTPALFPAHFVLFILFAAKMASSEVHEPSSESPKVVPATMEDASSEPVPDSTVPILDTSPIGEGEEAEPSVDSSSAAPGTPSETTGSAQETVVTAQPSEVQLGTTDAAPDGDAEGFTFDADMHQLMNMIIHAFYSTKDVFLRELLSNASDAIDKYRHTVLSGGKACPESDLHIRIAVDDVHRRIIVTDTGIGMTREELISNIGTIARSGTKAFMDALQSKDEALIGQFGVGFYASFLVADRVDVISRHMHSVDAFVWSSRADSSYTIRPAVASDMPVAHGTRIVLYLKESEASYLSNDVLQRIAKKHSSFVQYPIQFWTTRDVEVTNEASSEDSEDDEDGNDGRESGGVKIEDVSDAPTKQTVSEWKTFNSGKPVWMLDPKQVTEEQYDAFYKTLDKSYSDALGHLHFVAEGDYSFRALLYIPSRAPMDLFESGKSSKNVKLHVRRMFITDDVEDMVPPYLKFVMGIVDSDDLPLNVSRESLQQLSIMRVLKKTLTKRVLDHLGKMEEETYVKFYEQFGKNVKLGVHEDSQNRQRLLKLLRFQSSADPKALTSLASYVERMKDGQESIYYMTGPSRLVIERSPFLEKLRSDGYEVLYMVDAIDEYVMQTVRDYDDKKFVCATRDDLPTEADNDQKSFEPLCAALKSVLGSRVEKVVVSRRLSESPCCLVTGQYGWSANMERIMKSQALRDDSMTQYMVSQKTLEINTAHAIVQRLQACLVVPETDESSSVEESDSAAETGGAPSATSVLPATFHPVVDILYQTALIDSGFSLEDPHAFSLAVYRKISDALPPVGGE